MKILLLEKLALVPKVETYLRKHGFQIIMESDLTTNSVGDISVIWSGVRRLIDLNFVENFPNLKFLCFPTTGLTHVKLASRHQSIKIISLSEKKHLLSKITSTAELAIMFILMSLRRFSEVDTDIKEGNWRRENFVGNSFNSIKLGILGLGRLGSKVAEVSAIFGADVYYSDISDKETNFKRVSTAELFDVCDVISIHTPYSRENRKFVSKKLLARSKSNLAIINTARGELIDEDAVCEWLSKSSDRQYLTDVLTGEESFINSKIDPKHFDLLNKNNVIVTPHIGGACHGNFEYTQMLIADDLILESKKNET